ncbi:MAG TPA: DUF4255 domain-containing protein [Acidimicrobiales bacterium]|jgi:hypothetical protein|nr:DUF4255 domain-containing protein [Acidimicrobiales bacterium]
MIHDVDETLRAIVRREVINGSDIEVLFEAPTKDWASRRNTPTIDIYLYDIREDLKRRQSGDVYARDEMGRKTGKTIFPRFFKLSYLITCWTQRPEDEHRLLSAMLACFLKQDRIPGDQIVGSLGDTGWPIDITIALPPPEDRALSDVWSALGGELKPSLDLVCLVPVDTDRLSPVATLVSTPPTFEWEGIEGQSDTVKGRVPPEPGEDGADGADGDGASGREPAATAAGARAFTQTWSSKKR